MRTSRRGLFRLGVAAASGGIFAGRTRVARGEEAVLEVGGGQLFAAQHPPSRGHRYGAGVGDALRQHQVLSHSL